MVPCMTNCGGRRRRTFKNQFFALSIYYLLETIYQANLTWGTLSCEIDDNVENKKMPKVSLGAEALNKISIRFLTIQSCSSEQNLVPTMDIL